MLPIRQACNTSKAITTRQFSTSAAIPDVTRKRCEDGKTGHCFNADELVRYQRHFALPHVGIRGQARLKRASVLIIGAGGLGSPLAIHLASAGVGRIGLVDFDIVETSNLHRQPLHGASDVGRKKTASALDTVKEINPHVAIETYDVRFQESNAVALVRDYDIVTDGTDNFATRYLVNDACCVAGRPNVYGSVYRFEGQVSVFAHSGGPCYRCLFPTPPPSRLIPSCADGGVLGVLPGIIGSLQANEVLKIILEIGEPLVGRLLLFDALSSRFQLHKVARDPSCITCSGAPFTITSEQTMCPSSTDEVPEITPTELHTLQQQADSPFLLDVRNKFEVIIADIGGDQLIPIQELPDRLGEIRADPADVVVAFCRTGVRSIEAVRILLDAGFEKVMSLKGGTNDWSREIDQTIPIY